MTRESGFSLIEMLAALGVLAIAGIALMNALTTTIRATSLAQERAIAAMAADNLMAELMAERRVNALRDRSGSYELAGRAFDWTLDIERTGSFDLNALTLILTDPQTETEQARLESFVRSRS